jgi:hypothetical protein
LVVFSNFLGVALLAGGLIIALVLETRFGIKVGILVGAIPMIMIDFFYRRNRPRISKEISSLIDPALGGHFMFLPIWVLGLAAIIFALII